MGRSSQRSRPKLLQCYFQSKANITKCHETLAVLSCCFQKRHDRVKATFPLCQLDHKSFANNDGPVCTSSDYYHVGLCVAILLDIYLFLKSNCNCKDLKMVRLILEEIVQSVNCNLLMSNVRLMEPR